MAIVFVARGVSLDARYSSAGKAGFPYSNSGAVPVVQADAGAIGGQSVNVKVGSTARKGVSYNGGSNFALGSTGFTILLRVAPAYTGTPTANRGLLGFNGPSSVVTFGYGFMRHRSDNAKIDFFFGGGANGAQTLTTITTDAWSPTAGTWYDIAITWNGTTAANGVNIYIDGTLAGTSTASAVIAPAAYRLCSIEVGCEPNGVNGDFDFSELVLWDSVVAVDGFTGAARSTFVAANEFDGQSASSSSARVGASGFSL